MSLHSIATVKNNWHVTAAMVGNHLPRFLIYAAGNQIDR
jgi:hypothetical protein